MEQEGVILRNPGRTSGATDVTAVYDPLGGHLVADAILGGHGRTGFEKWVRDPSTVTKLAGPLADQHPLAMDIFRAFVGLVPSRLHRQQFWPLVDEPLRTAALREAANLEGSYLDAQTVEELATVAAKPRDRSRDLFDRLWSTRGAPNHPLNAAFLDFVLRSMAMAARDVRWTEWVRHSSDELFIDLKELEKRWRGRRQERSPADRLRAQWVMWLLTSTVRKLRDQASLALYWFGRGDPATLFNMTIDALSINDPYVPERMLAASYGVTMGYQNEPPFTTKILPGYAQALYDKMFTEGAAFSTTHILARDYASHTIQIGLLRGSVLISKEGQKRTKPPFKDGGIRSWGESEDKNKDEYRDGNYPFGLDFDNYTIGYLLPKRRNYDFDDPEYVNVKANIWWRIYQLGYSLEDFREIDKDIARQGYKFGRKANGSKVDRYGKKYCWIAWHEMAGYRQDNGLLKGEWDSYGDNRFTIDIDPSFPNEVQNVEIIRTNYLGKRLKSLPNWITKGSIPDIKPYLLLEKIQNEQGPWVLLDGFIEQEDLDCRRNIFIFPRGLFLKREEYADVVQRLKKQNLGGRWLPEIPEHHYVFAGEVPWCETFSYNGENKLSFIEHIKIKRVPFEQTEYVKHGRKVEGKELMELLKILRDYLSKEKSENDLIDFLVQNAIAVKKTRRYRLERTEMTQDYEVIIPVTTLNFGAQSAVNAAGHAYVPSRELCEAFDLSSRPQTFDLYDASDKRASIYTRWGDEWHSFHKLIYMRKDLLDKILSEKAMDLVWGIWGERSYKSKNNIGFHEFSKKHKPYKVFRDIVAYRRIIS